MYEFPVLDGTQGQNFSSIVRQCKRPSLSREIGEIQKSSCHGNVTPHFSLWSALLSVLTFELILSNSTKKYMKNSEENIHVDTPLI